eukprot:7915391-Heterocapsa_arctica.AAC.1
MPPHLLPLRGRGHEAEQAGFWEPGKLPWGVHRVRLGRAWDTFAAGVCGKSNVCEDIASCM